MGKQTKNLTIVGLVVLVLVIGIIAYFYFEQKPIGLGIFQIIPTLRGITPTPKPTFKPQSGIIKKIEGQILTVESEAKKTITATIIVGTDVKIYRYLSAGAEDKPPASEKVTLSDLKVGDKITLYYENSDGPLEAIYAEAE